MYANLIIFLGFILVCSLYYKFLHKKVINSLDAKIQNIAQNISLSELKLEEQFKKLSDLEQEFADTEILFQQTCEQINAELNEIRVQKLQLLEDEMLKDSENLEAQAMVEYNIQQANIKDKIIETAYLVAIEYFRNKKNYSEDDKKKILEKLFKNIKLN